MFKKKRCKISFVKSYQFADIGAWYEVTDFHVLNVLKNIQSQYEFDIISARLKDCFGRSEITIKCLKTDKNKIFNKFMGDLSGQITKVRF